MRFRIEYISTSSPTYVVARHLDEGHFEVNQHSLLGGVRIQPWVSQPRALHPDGTPDLKIFAFQLRASVDRKLLEVSSIVILN